MPAYVIVDVKILDENSYDEYKKLTPPSLIPYEGKFIVRGGQTQTLEGQWQPARIVVLEFPTIQKARQWWESPEYHPAKLIRQRSASTNMIVVEGYP